MNVVFINPAHDAAGCSYRQAAAINKYTNHTARHFRAVRTFYDPLDIGPENYNADEFASLIEKADLLHFCSAAHTFPSPMEMSYGYRSFNWGFNMADLVKNKKKIFHDYNSFAGHWAERAKAHDVWNKCKDIGYDAIFSSIPQATLIYDGCVYVPDLVDEQDEWFMPGADRDMSQLHLCHFPTGGGNNKNTQELLHALTFMGIQNQHPEVIRTSMGMTNKNVLGLKKKSNFGFDAIWRGFHGATAVENLSMGIPTMCSIDKEFSEIFNAYFSSDKIPFEDVKTVDDIIKTIKFYSEDNAALVARCNEVREFMVEKWSAKNIAENIIKAYENII